MKLPMLKHDKANHFIYGLLIFALSNIFLGYLLSSLICSLFAFGKEVYDHYHTNHTPDLMDAIVTMAGGATALLIAFFH